MDEMEQAMVIIERVHYYSDFAMIDQLNPDNLLNLHQNNENTTNVNEIGQNGDPSVHVGHYVIEEHHAMSNIKQPHL